MLRRVHPVAGQGRKSVDSWLRLVTLAVMDGKITPPAAQAKKSGSPETTLCRDATKVAEPDQGKPRPLAVLDFRLEQEEAVPWRTTCAVCGAPLAHRRRGSITCGGKCRQWRYRDRKAVA